MNNIIPFLLLIFLIVLYWLYRRYSKGRLAKAVVGINVGIDGWLLLLVFGMLVLNPLSRVGVIEKIYINNGGAYSGAWLTIAIVIFGGMVSMYGGWELARGKTPNAVRRAKIALWVQVVVGTLLLPMTLDGGIALIQTSIVATVWTLYLSKSKRVKATYNIAPPAPALITKATSLTPSDVPSSSHPIIEATSKEIIAFRFLLLAWGVSFLMLCFAGFAYVRGESYLDNVKQEAQSQIACTTPAYRSIPACNSIADGSSDICNQLVRSRCSSDSYDILTNQLWENKNIWTSYSKSSLYVSLIIMFLSSLSFYGIRWAMTGRLKPLWLLRLNK